MCVDRDNKDSPTIMGDSEDSGDSGASVISQLSREFCKLSANSPYSNSHPGDYDYSNSHPGNSSSSYSDYDYNNSHPGEYLFLLLLG